MNWVCKVIHHLKSKRKWKIHVFESIIIFLIYVFCVSGVDGQQYWGVNYSASYVCALKGSTVKMSCTLKYPRNHEIITVFWTKPAVTDEETPNLCLDPENRGRVQCDSEYKDTYSLTLTSVTEDEKHMYYCRFTTNRENGRGFLELSWTSQVVNSQKYTTDTQTPVSQTRLQPSPRIKSKSELFQMK